MTDRFDEMARAAVGPYPVRIHESDFGVSALLDSVATALRSVAAEMDGEIERLKEELRDHEDEMEVLFSQRKSLIAHVDVLHEGLVKVLALGRMTLQCDPADFDFNAEDAYDGGAVSAFCQASEIASEALARATELGGGGDG